jgi:pimeloyl-ACP methyl ester carboxylesterase
MTARPLLLALLLSCRDPASTPVTASEAAPGPAPAPASASASAPAPASASAPDSASSSTGLPPIVAFFESLPVAGHPDAFVSLPTGATSRRPVVVVIHGAGDRPDWQCGGWRRATGEGHVFVVCPRGRVDPGSSTKDDIRFTHASGAALLAYIDASLAAIAARYPDHADIERPLLAGFSLGSFAILGLAVKQPDRFPRIALVEGATDAFDDARARAFVAGGGQRVLFGCGQRGCEAAAKLAAQRLDARDHLPVHVAFALVHHTFDPPLEDAVGAELPWLLEGDPRW